MQLSARTLFVDDREESPPKPPPATFRAGLAARGESPSCIRRALHPELPALSHFLQGSNAAGILPRRAVRWRGAASITTKLGATLDCLQGLIG